MNIKTIEDDNLDYSLHPDAEELCNRMCGYSTGCVSEAIIAYFKRPDCSGVTREEIYEYLSQLTK